MTDAIRGKVKANAPLRVRPGHVKSRIIEAHAPEESPDGCAALLEELAGPAGLHVQRIADDLWGLRGQEDSFFVDVLNRRFWQLHTTAPAQRVDTLLRKHLLRDTRLDRAWLSHNQLAQIEGERMWMRSSFASDRLLPSQAKRARRWRVQIEGEAPEELLEFLSGDPRYAPSAALSAIGTAVSEPGIGEARIVADFRGGLTSDSGTFELVAGVVWRAVRRYERYIRSIEDTYRLRAEPDQDLGLVIDGDVAFIVFPNPVTDLLGLVDGLFACREPFRLWAVPREVAAGQWEANAVDLHVGHPVRLEITERWLRVLLDEHTCGNTLARLVANLQHHLDARIDEQAVAA